MDLLGADRSSEISNPKAVTLGFTLALDVTHKSVRRGACLNDESAPAIGDSQHVHVSNATGILHCPGKPNERWFAPLVRQWRYLEMLTPAVTQAIMQKCFILVALPIALDVKYISRSLISVDGVPSRLVLEVVSLKTELTEDNRNETDRKLDLFKVLTAYHRRN